MEKEMEKVLSAVENLKVSHEQGIMILSKLLEVIHKHDLDNEAVAALKECGVELEFEVE